MSKLHAETLIGLLSLADVLAYVTGEELTAMPFDAATSEAPTARPHCLGQPDRRSIAMNLAIHAAYKSAVAANNAQQAKELLAALIEESKPLVLARVEKLTGGQNDDLAQAGLIGLLWAVKHYDPANGSFEPYAKNWIRAEQNRLVDNGPLGNETGERIARVAHRAAVKNGEEPGLAIETALRAEGFTTEFEMLPKEDGNVVMLFRRKDRCTFHDGCMTIEAAK